MSLALVIGNKNISSWSMRPWVLLREAGIAFEERMVHFGSPDWTARVGSPSGRVPLLIENPGGAGELRVWDSLAIAERVNELFPEKQLWPADPRARAQARAASAEMHSGFPDLRRECSFNLTSRFQRELTEACRRDIARVDGLLAGLRDQYGTGGDLLFGDFSIADAMFAPVASRARTYGLKLSAPTQRYFDALWSLKSVQQWSRDAQLEVDAGIADPVAHGALFSRAEAGAFAKRWVDALNSNDLSTLRAQCTEEIAARLEAPKAPLALESFAWDGDANRLALSLREGAHARAELLAFDSWSKVAALQRIGA